MKKLVVVLGGAALCAAVARAEEPAETEITFLGDVMCHDSMMTAYKTTEGKFDFSEVGGRGARAGEGEGAADPRRRACL